LECLSLIPFPLCTLSLLISTYTTCKATVKKSFWSSLSTTRAVFVRKLLVYRLVYRLVRKLVVLVRRIVYRLVRIYRLVRRLVRRLVVLVVLILTFPRWPIKACDPGCPYLLFPILLTFISLSIFLSFYIPICLFTFSSNICFVLLLFRP